MADSVDIPQKATASGEAGTSSTYRRIPGGTAQDPANSSQIQHGAAPSRREQAPSARNTASAIPLLSDMPGGSTKSSQAAIRGNDKHEESEKTPMYCRSWFEVLRDAGTSVVSRTGDVDSIRKHAPQCTMLDPKTALRDMKSDDTKQYLAWVAACDAMDDASVKANRREMNVIMAAENYVVNLGVAMMEEYPGPHYTFVDPRRTRKDQIVIQAIRMSKRFEQALSDSRRRVIFTLPATPEGIAAARELEKEHDVRTNLNLVFSFKQALACIEAGASAITFSCTPMIKAYEFARPATAERYPPSYHPCIQEIQATIAYVHMNGCDTQVMVSDPLGIQSIEPLLGLDYLAVGQADADMCWPPRHESSPTREIQFYSALKGSAAVQHASEAPYPPQPGENKVFGLDTPLQVKQMGEMLKQDILKKCRWDMAHIVKVMRKHVNRQRRHKPDIKTLSKRVMQGRRSILDDPALLEGERQLPRTTRPSLQRQHSALLLE